MDIEQTDGMRRIRSHMNEVDNMLFRSVVDGRISNNSISEIKTRFLDCVKAAEEMRRG